MELELGLALALPVHNPVKGFDLSNYGVMNSEMVGLESKNQQAFGKKRSVDVAFEKKKITAGNESKKMLSLLLWNGQPNEEDDGKGRRDAYTSVTKNEGEGNCVVGWPPIKSWRKKMLHEHHHGQYDDHPLQNDQILAHNNKENGQNVGRPANSMYVKVKMEGVGIVRKIDIKLHHSYQTLRDTLITMFSKCQRCEKDGNADQYILTYQDRQGDWLLAQDVPWQTFIESVQRLQMLRNGG